MLKYIVSGPTPHWCLPLFTLITTLISGTYLPAQQCQASMQGMVQQGGAGDALPFAMVAIIGTDKHVMTDENGQFRLDGLCPDSLYSLEINYISRSFTTPPARPATGIVLSFPDDAVLQEVVVTGAAAKAVNTAADCTVDHLDFVNKQSMSLGEMVRQLPGVTTLQTGANISKPVIQGLHSNRVAIVSNNVVLESQQWGSEHAPEIDPFSSEKVTVVKGAEGVRYGVGAMAGAVVLEPAPLREKPGFGGWITTGVFTNGRAGALAGALDYRLPNEKWAFRAQGTLKRGGNLRAPDYWLYNTGHAEHNFAVSGQWKPSARQQHEITYSSVSQQLAILKSSHLGNVEQILEAAQLDTPVNNINRFTYAINRPYQEIHHQTLKYRYSRTINDFWKWNLQYSWQYNQRNEYDVVRKTGNAADKPQVAFNLYSNTLDWGMEHRAKKYWQGEFGVQVQQFQNYVNRGAFIPNYNTAGASLWAHERYRKFGLPVEWEVGIRYDYRYSHVFTSGNFGRDINTHVQFGNISGVTGLHYHLGETFTATVHTGYAWRPPSMYELFARGVHHGAGTYEEGDSTLISEKALNSNLTLTWNSSKRKGLNASLTFYRNQVRDFIYLDPANTVKVTVRGPFPAYYYKQANVVLQGLDAQADVPLAAGFTAEVRASLIRAWRKLDSPDAVSGESTDPLPLMPSGRYQYGLRWNGNEGRTTVRLMGNTVLQQTRIPSVGLLKDPPPGFTTFSFDASHSWTTGGERKEHNTKEWELGFTVQNLTNTRYREYLNFFRFYADEPGINAGLRLRLNF